MWRSPPDEESVPCLFRVGRVSLPIKEWEYVLNGPFEISGTYELQLACDLGATKGVLQFVSCQRRGKLVTGLGVEASPRLRCGMPELFDPMQPKLRDLSGSVVDRGLQPASGWPIHHLVIDGLPQALRQSIRHWKSLDREVPLVASCSANADVREGTPTDAHPA